MTIEERWREHLATGFPAGCRGSEVAGVDLVLLDADTTGCIRAFIDSAGHPSLAHTAMLGLLLRNLSRVVEKLAGEEQAYYARLENLAELVLEDVVRSNLTQLKAALGRT